MRQAYMVLVMAGLAACGSESRSAIQWMTPHNGATAVDLSTRPAISFTDAADVNIYPADERKVVLYTVTGGKRGGAIKGSVDLEQGQITYVLSAGTLDNARDYLLEVKESVFDAGDIDDIDASEWPEEPLTWPFQLRFSTRSRPRVRAAYLDVEGGRRAISIYFSQPMNPVLTEKALGIKSMTGSTVSFGPPVWTGKDSVRLFLTKPLEKTAIYILEVNRTAAATDGTLLDGNDNGKAGETSDTFSKKFTGTQQVIGSRLPKRL